MSFAAWFRKFQSNTLRRLTCRKSASSFRPQMEGLEDRSLPSTFTVLNLNDSGPDSLRAAVAAADGTSGAVINFAPSLHGTIALTSGQLNLTSNMTINGTGANKLTVSGSNHSRVFDVGPGVIATLSGLTIANGAAMSTTDPSQQSGGGVLNEIGATVYVTNDVFSNNRALVASGALENVGGSAITGPDPATAIISGTTFVGNQAIGSVNGTTNPYLEFDGFAPGAGTAEGGAIDDDGILTLTNSTFVNNQALGVAGTDGVSASAHGGALSVDGSATVSRTSFIGNQALGGSVPAGFASSQGIGGAVIDFASASFSNCRFTDNEAVGGAGNTGAANSPAFVGAGGGILALGGASLTVSGSTFDGNQAIGGAGAAGGGGGLSFGGGLDVHAGTTCTLSNSLFHDNAAVGGAGGSGGAGGAGVGGGISVEIFAKADISGVVVTSNRAIGGAGGGGAEGGGGYGGGIAVGGRTIYDGPDGSSVTISDSVFNSNAAVGGAGGLGGNGGGGFGGGVFVGATEGPFTPSLAVSDSNINANEADGGAAGVGGGSTGLGIGGGVYSLGDFDILETVIAGNHASTSNDNRFP